MVEVNTRYEALAEAMRSISSLSRWWSRVPERRGLERLCTAKHCADQATRSNQATLPEEPHDTTVRMELKREV